MKSTTIAGLRFADQAILYDLAVRNYNHLRKVVNDRPPRLLVLFVMPENEEEWLVQRGQSLSLHHCCYYSSLEGLPSTSNQYSIAIAIPEMNVFSAEYLRRQLLKQERR